MLQTIPQIHVYQIKIPAHTTVPEMVQRYLSLPKVEFVEPNVVYSTLIRPNDPRYSEQWALPTIKAEQAWNIKTRGRDRVRCNWEI